MSKIHFSSITHTLNGIQRLITNDNFSNIKKKLETSKRREHSAAKLLGMLFRSRQIAVTWRFKIRFYLCSLQPLFNKHVKQTERHRVKGEN